MLRLYSLVAAGAGVVISSSLAAQRPVPLELADSAVSRILAGTSDSPGSLSAMLRNVNREMSRAKRDLLADSVVERAINSLRKGDGLARNYIYALATAGAPGPDGEPYEGAALRLIRIHREAPESPADEFPMRSMVLHALTESLGYAVSVPYLRRIATTDGFEAWVAMSALIAGATPGYYSQIPAAERQRALEAVAAIWAAVEAGPRKPFDRSGRAPAGVRDVVPNEYALRALGQFARAQGWIKDR